MSYTIGVPPIGRLCCVLHRQAYGAVQTSLSANGVLKGALFWEWLSNGESATDTGVRETDSTWQCAAD